MSFGTELALVPLLILANAFFVAAEYAVVATRPAEIDNLRRRKKLRAARSMEKLKGDPASAIGAIQVCITMTNLMLGWIGEPAMTTALQRMLGPAAEIIPPAIFKTFSTAMAFVTVTFLTVVLSELLPKALTLRYAEFFAQWTATPVVLILAIAWPLVWLMNLVANSITVPLGLGRVDEAEKTLITIDEIRRVTSEAAADGVVTPRERSLILNSLALGLRTAKQIMVPRVKVVFVDLQRSMDENRRVMGAYLHSRLPLCNGGMDHVIGIIHVKEFLTAHNADADSTVLQLIARPVTFAPETITVDKLLAMFHERHTEMIVLADEHGGVEGIATLQDVIDELLAGTSGEILTPASGTTWRLPGDTPIHEIAERLGQPDWAADYRNVVTLNGLMVAHLGRVPQPFEEIEIQSIRMRAIETTPHAVTTVELNRRPAPDSPAPAEKEPE